MLRICCFGHYFPAYPHNWVFQEALRVAGNEIIEVRSDEPRILRRWWALARALRGERFDILFVGWPGHTDVPLAWLYGRWRGAPVIFDAFVSLHEGYVEDRAIFKPRSLRARLLRRLDVLACNLSDVVLLDTNEHIRYFKDELGARRSRFERVFVGADSRAMVRAEPSTADEGPRVVGLYASFLPLQGIGTVLAAAAMLADSETNIRFALAGRGFELRELQQQINDLPNLDYVGELSYLDLVKFMQGLDVCLGVFGTTPKTSRVIPNKVFDAMALAKPIITGNTPAIRELLVDGETAVLVPVDDPPALADAIVQLADDPERRARLGLSAKTMFDDTASIPAIAQSLAEILTSVAPVASHGRER